jgi:autotransporter-associated beta strand protein
LNGADQTLAGLKAIARTSRIQQIANTPGTPVTLTITNTLDAAWAGNIAAASISVVKTGDGKQTFSRTNAYAGTTTINAGNLQFEVGGRCANSTVILNATTATNGVSITTNTTAWTSGGLTAAAAGVLEFDFGAVTPSTSISPLNIIGVADFSAATPKVRVVTTGILPGTYPLMTWGSILGTAPTTTDLTVDVLAPLTSATLSVVGSTLYLDIASTGGTVVKANNTTNLNLGTSWVGGVAPTSTKVAKWDNTVTTPNTTVLGGDVTWAGIEIANPAGLVTINAGNTLTLGGASTNIDLSAATADLTLNCALALGFDSTWGVQSGRTLTVAGAVSGTNDLAIQNAGTVILSSGANSYSGNTTVGTTSMLKLGAANVIPNGDDKGSVTVEGTLDLNTFPETINGLNGAGTVDTVAGGTPALTLGSTNTSATFTGIIQDTTGTLSLTKTGPGRQDLVGANTFSGAVLVNQGWLVVGETNAPLANVSSITVADGAAFGAYGAETDIDVPVTLGAGNPTINIVAPITPLASGANTVQRHFRLNGGITGNGNVVFKGVNPFNWTGSINVSNCTYTGSTLMTCDLIPGIALTNNNNIVVRLLGDDALPTTTVVTMDGDIGVGSGRFCDLILNGHNQTLAGLTNIPRDLRSQRVVNPDASAAAALTVSNSADYTFSGFLGAASGGSNPGNNLSLLKSGSGTFTLSKTSGTTYANGTTVNGGTLLVNNTTGSGTGTGDVTVNSGGTLGGTGSIAGNVTVNAGGSLAPGASIGTLTLGGTLTLDAFSTNTFEVDGSTPTNDVVVLGSTVAYGGVLKIVPTGSFTNGQTFTVFSGVGATNPSNFASVASTGGTTFSFTNGILTVVSAGSVTPPPTLLTNSVSGSTLSLSWPAGQGWRLQEQTNSRSVGLRSNWVFVAGASVSSTNITVDKTRPTVFYRLIFP